MKRNRTQFSRLVELDRRIRDGRNPNCHTFAEEWEGVSSKTVQRDIDYLRDQLGAPIEYDFFKKGYYYTDLNWFLPALSLSEGDLVALLLGSRIMEAYRGSPVARELQNVFAKISGLLSDKLTIKPELVFSKFSFTSPPSKPVDEEVWITLVRGLLHLRCVVISYRSLETDVEKGRVIEPWHMANLSGEWYVFAFCRLRKEVIQFAIPRITSAKLLEQTFQVSPDFDIHKRLEAAFGRFVMGDDTSKVRLLFRKEVAEYALEKQWHPHQKVHRRRNGDIELEFKTPGLWEVFRWVLSWGKEVKVLEPTSLRKQVADEVKVMSKRA